MEIPTLESLRLLKEAMARRPPNPKRALTERLNNKLTADRVLKKILRLKMEGIRLFRTLPHLIPFQECGAKWRLVIGGNRSSKTATCAYESCLAWLGLDPFDKYVKTGGNSLVVAKELDDVSRLWRTCSEEGQFKIIRDEITGDWRAVRPDPANPAELDPYDEAYREQWKDAPPLIPPRLLPPRCVAWGDKGKRIPRIVHFPQTNWKVLFRSGNGDSPQGDHYTHGWLDEEIGNELFYQELNRGLVATVEPPQHSPKGIWSATLQAINVQLFTLLDAANSGSEHVKSFFTTIEMNPYVSREAKEAYRATLTEDELQFRYYGIPPRATRMVYHPYSPMGIHGCEPFCVPDDWCRYLIIDPGRDHCGVLFGAVDPDESHRWIYNGFDLRHGDAMKCAAKVRELGGDLPFEAFIMDQQMGKQHHPGEGESVAFQYYKALKDAGIEPLTQGPMDGFFAGSKHVEARTESLLSWMHVRPSGPYAGKPLLQVFRGVVPELDRQISMAVTDPKKVNNRKKDKYIPQDMLDCLEYFAAHGPRYVKPKIIIAEPPTVWDRFQEQKKKEKQRQRSRRRLSSMQFGCAPSR